MILIIEPHKSTRKILCDLLSRERIITADSIPESLEMLCKFRNNFNLIISNIQTLYDIFSRGTMFKLCEKLYISVPPILGLFTKVDETIKAVFEKKYKQYKLIEYSEDVTFPGRYIEAVKELYPDVIIDLAKAQEAWSRKDEVKEPIDTRAWLEQEGFIKHGEQEKGEPNYKKMYFELKKKYDELVNYLKNIPNSKDK
jgi:hypothetical protein